MVSEASAHRCCHFEGQQREESTDVNVFQQPASVHRSNDGGGDDVAWEMGGGQCDGSRERETKSALSGEIARQQCAALVTLTICGGHDVAWAKVQRIMSLLAACRLSTGNIIIDCPPPQRLT